jgi:hypothetical protein
MAGEVEKQSDINLNHNFLVLDTIRKMRDAEALNDDYTFFVFCENSLQLLIPFMPLQTRAALNDDMKAMRLELKRIKTNETTKEESRKRQELDIRRDFADSHKHLVFIYLSRSGIVVVQDEGMIDFQKHDFDQVSKIVQYSGTGMPSAIANIKDQEQRKDAKEAAKDGLEN